MDFNDLSLEEQIELMTDNADGLPKMALLGFASKLKDMSEAGEKIYIAAFNDDRQDIATIDMGKSVWFAFTDEEKFNNLPDEIKSQLVLKSFVIQDLLDLFVEKSTADGIAFNPFSNDNGIFFADRNVLVLAW